MMSITQHKLSLYLLVNMNQVELESVIKESQEKALQQIENKLQGEKGDKLYCLTYLEASYIEREIRQLPRKEGEAYFLEVQRRPQQTLFKPAIRDHHYNSFAQEEYASLERYYRSMQLADGKMTSNEFYCFLTLQLLRLNNLSDYFMHAPNIIFLKMPDYYDKILKPLDMTIIGHKLFRGQYINTLDQFQVDMVTMIHNARIYFADNDEMFQISILFEQLFWKIYKQEIHKYQDAVKEYQRLKRQLRTKVKKPQLKQYTRDDRKRINAAIKKQPLEVQASIRKFLQQKCKNQMKNGEISIQKISRPILAKIQKMFVSISGDNDIYDESEDNPIPLLEVNQAIGNITIEDALGSDDDD